MNREEIQKVTTPSQGQEPRNEMMSGGEGRGGLEESLAGESVGKTGGARVGDWGGRNQKSQE